MATENRGNERDEVVSRAREVLGEAAGDWLRAPNRALGCAPVELLGSAEGVERVLRVLGRIEHGVVS